MKKEQVIKWFDGMAFFSLCALLFTLPFSKSFLEAFFVCALVFWVLKRAFAYKYTRSMLDSIITAFKPIKTCLNLPIAAFMLVGLFSMALSVSLPLSLEGFFFKLFEWVMIYFIVAETINSRKRLNMILGVIFFSVLLITADGIFQCITGVDFIRKYPILVDRIQASFGTPNSFAGWLVVMLPLALSLSYSELDDYFDLSEKKKRLKKLIRIGLWLISGLALACLVLTYTRGAWIAVMLSLIFLGILKGKRALILISIPLLLVAFVGIRPAFLAEKSIDPRVFFLFRIHYTLTIQRPYVDLCREALAIIKDFPIFGSGLNTYAVVGPHYKVFEAGGYYPHNCYLQMAAEMGLLGLGAFLWVIGTLFSASFANLKKIKNGFHGAVLIGLLMGLFGFLLHSTVDTNFYTLQLGNFMWLVIGLVVAVQKISLSSD